MHSSTLRSCLKPAALHCLSKSRTGINRRRGTPHCGLGGGSNLEIATGAKVKDIGLLMKRLSEQPGNVIMSAENFSWIFSQEEIDNLEKQSRLYFDEVKIIVYLRRQDRQIISHHQQASKSSESGSYCYYAGDSFAIPKCRPHFDEYLNYHDRIGKWAHAFGKENMIIRIFDPETLLNGDVVSDFFQQIGIDFDTNEASYRSNESLGFERTKVGHLVNQALPKSFLSRRIRHNADNSGKSLPGITEAKAFYARYAASNIKLNQELNITSEHEDIFGDDFSI